MKTVKQLLDLVKRKRKKISKLEAAIKKEKGIVDRLNKSVPAARKAEAAKKSKPKAKKKKR
jgi:cell division septum initiation protein DivIVA